MSITTLDLNMAIGTIVESMLPRFSDDKLGLMVSMDMSFDDWGYAEDGNTRACNSKHIRIYPHLLFVRSSNYTKVFFWMAEKGAKGMDISAKYAKNPVEWELTHDHDSSWRDFQNVTQLSLNAWDKFKDRRKFIHEFHHIDTLEYRLLEVCEQKDKNAERWSKEERVWLIKTRAVERADLEYIRSTDTQKMRDSGLLIKGSETYQKYADLYNRLHVGA